MSAINLYEEWRKGFEAGYMWGRMDASDGREYDARTPKERGSIEKLTESTGETGNHRSPSETSEMEAVA